MLKIDFENKTYPITLDKDSFYQCLDVFPKTFKKMLATCRTSRKSRKPDHFIFIEKDTAFYFGCFVMTRKVEDIYNYKYAIIIGAEFKDEESINDINIIKPLLYGLIQPTKQAQNPPFDCMKISLHNEHVYDNAYINRIFFIT